MFDEKTLQQLGSYVYMLTDPVNKKPFYIGKGKDNRVFDHLNCALKDDFQNAKYDKIREINSQGLQVEHVIIRHGLNEKEAFIIEASLIDAFNYSGILLTNKVCGRNSIEKGIMSTSEINRMYKAEPLNVEDLGDDCIIININRNYRRASGADAIYQATKETWTIDSANLFRLRYVLSEFRGLIVEVFEVMEWYPKERGYLPKSKKFGQTKIGYGFNGIIAPDEVRNLFLHKSLMHLKKRGAATAIRYNFTL